uniref:DNA-directed RNA polymerase n=1 Tax=Bursaphelenchus xylophilus TaxID=6326 RepID=A0A1I7SNQ3_BURXY
MLTGSSVSSSLGINVCKFLKNRDYLVGDCQKPYVIRKLNEAMVVVGGAEGGAPPYPRFQGTGSFGGT